MIHAPYPGNSVLTISHLTAGTSLSQSGLPFGAAQAGRYLVAAIASRGTSGLSLSSCMIGGVASNIINTVTNSAGGGSSRCAGIAIAKVPLGDTGAISISFSAAPSSVLFNLYSIFGLSAAAAARQNTSTANSPVASLQVKKGGVAVAAAVGTALNSPGSSWINLTEDIESSPTSLNLTGAHTSFSADNALLSLTCSFSGTSVSGCAGAFAVFDP